ncbi:hypothetical protein, partial [Parabacteroides distasonis]|uniref:hypothetical protein n=1 Tax=Parabacteroides distasonis TaxID=823 RepID=UPI0039B3D3BD
MQIKIYISFLITALFLCVPHTRAQEIEVPITLNEHGTQLRDVLRKIEQQSPYLCKYSINSLVYWVTYVHNVVYSFYRS